jgi:hypothetical protein
VLLGGSKAPPKREPAHRPCEAWIGIRRQSLLAFRLYDFHAVTPPLLHLSRLLNSFAR